MSAFIKFNPHVFVLNAYAGFHYVPSTSVQQKSDDLRNHSKLRYVLRQAVSLTLPLRVSGHAVIQKPTVMVISTTLVL